MPDCRRRSGWRPASRSTPMKRRCCGAVRCRMHRSCSAGSSSRFRGTDRPTRRERSSPPRENGSRRGFEGSIRVSPTSACAGCGPARPPAPPRAFRSWWTIRNIPARAVDWWLRRTRAGAGVHARAAGGGACARDSLRGLRAGASLASAPSRSAFYVLVRRSTFSVLRSTCVRRAQIAVRRSRHVERSTPNGERRTTNGEPRPVRILESVSACSCPMLAPSFCAVRSLASAPRVRALDGIEVHEASRAMQPGELVVLTIDAPASAELVTVTAFGRAIPAARVDASQLARAGRARSRRQARASTPRW